MNGSNDNNLIQLMIQNLFNTYALMHEIVLLIHKNKGTAFLVGGAVRDYFMGRAIKDIDIEVHGINEENLVKLLSSFGPVHRVGASFGIFSVPGCEIEWALPRHDSPGRKPTVSVDPFMDIKEACSRRDLAMNGMAINCITGELIDSFGGRKDISDKILRTPEPLFFVQDPLRFYRVMQFIGRFDMNPDDTLNEVCSRMDITGVSRERIEQEIKKLLLLSRYPSRGIRWLQKINRLEEIFPEIAALIAVAQDPEWHPEGDVFEHSMQALDAAAEITYPCAFITIALRYAALCHDMGKAVSSCLRNGRWTAHGHAVTGVPISYMFLRRITRDKELIKVVKKCVLYHMAPGEFVKTHASAAAYKRLAADLFPEINLDLLADLSVSDKKGRNAQSSEPLSNGPNDIQIFRDTAQKYGVLYEPERAILTGKDFLDVISEGPELGAAVDCAYKIQINSGITDKTELKKRTVAQLHDRVGDKK